MHRLLVALPLVVAGCGTVAPTPSTQPAPTADDAAPTTAPRASSVATALSSCAGNQIRLTPGTAGAAAGTAYLTVFVELAQGPACELPFGPMVSVRDAHGAEVARASEVDAKPIDLTDVTRYYIAWSGNCGPALTGDLVAHIEFSSRLVVDMPMNGFRPSCVDGAGQSISMYGDPPAS